MDLYVISSCWYRDGATVIGAGADLSDAMAIGDRYSTGNDAPAARGWRGWEPSEPHASGRYARWCRDALTDDGDIHPSLSQEIVKVPLAGFTFGGGVPGPLKTRREVTPPPGSTFAEMVEAMRTVAAMPKPPGKLRVGKGAAWDWLRRGLDQMDTYPSGKTMPDSIAAGILGIDVVLDPNIPPNMMKLAGKTYVVDKDSVTVLDDQVVRLLDPLPVPVADGAFFGFTSRRD